MRSPYRNKDVSEWRRISEKLLRSFPLSMKKMAEIVLDSWDGIFESNFGAGNYRVGEHIFPQPQIMGFLLHEIIPLELERLYPGLWRRGLASHDPDAVFLSNNRFSFEIKTSSSESGIFGNRSYAHLSLDSQKSRSRYFLAVNFNKFTPEESKPGVKLIRFGWLDSTDWIGQKSETGQQVRLTPEAKAYKLIVVWESKKR